MSTTRKTIDWELEFRLEAVFLVSVLAVTPLQGCSSTENSRLSHYRSGGSYFGGGPAVSPDRATTETRRVGEGSEGTFSPDAQQIAVVAGEYGREIDVMNIDGSGRRTIYSRNTTVSHPAYLPDGRGVLFLEAPTGRGLGNIILVNLEDLSARTVVDTR
jgi:hypothetical protein